MSILPVWRLPGGSLRLAPFDFSSEGQIVRAQRVTWMADETLEWMIEAPGSGDTPYYDLVASVRGPDTSTPIAELDRLVGSITIATK